MFILKYFSLLFFLIITGCSDNTSFHVITNLMDGLTTFDISLNPVPAIAKKWVISDNGKRYTFYLRDDVYWTDGVPVTAYDFEFSWERLLSPAVAAEYAYFLYDINNAQEYNSGKIKDFFLVGIKAINKH